MSANTPGEIRQTKPLTFNQLLHLVRKQFGLDKSYYPSIDIRIGYTGCLEIRNVSDVNQASDEHIAFMVETIKQNGGLIQRGDGRKSIVLEG